MPRMQPTEALARLGHRLRARRLFLQLPPNWTAEQMKMSRAQLGEYERGAAHPPALTLKRMADVLGTTVGDLLGERRRDNTEDVDRALRLFADPAIFMVANSMARMDHATRQSVVNGIREMDI